MDHTARLKELHEQYNSVTSGTAKRDLFKLWKNCVNLYTEMDKELVECRRYQRVTPKYTDLEQQLDSAIELLEQYITFAKLLY